MRINFGDLVIGDIAKDRIKKALDKNWVTEGGNVREFASCYKIFKEYFT